MSLNSSVNTCQNNSDNDNITLASSFNGIIAVYRNYEGPSFSDPRNTSKAQIVAGLCKIIEIEGPMLCKRAYNIYLRGCGINRMGPGLKRTLNQALNQAVKNRRITVENELNQRGFIPAIVRLTGTPPIVLRKRGLDHLKKSPQVKY